MSDLHHVLLDLGTDDYHFPAVEYHIVYVTCTMFTKHSRTLKLYNSRKPSIVYTKSPMFIKQSPKLRSPPPPIYTMVTKIIPRNHDTIS